eukprot:m.563405 g.563405  ORF g.563405 m.563405 type:complete len:109 (-) comp22231_c1_seq2:9-335(-)
MLIYNATPAASHAYTHKNAHAPKHTYASKHTFAHNRTRTHMDKLIVQVSYTTKRILLRTAPSITQTQYESDKHNQEIDIIDVHALRKSIWEADRSIPRSSICPHFEPH